MLGAQGTRRYMMAFENNAEARGLGGLPGAYAILRADHGKVSFERFGTDNDFAGLTCRRRASTPTSCRTTKAPTSGTTSAT